MAEISTIARPYAVAAFKYAKDKKALAIPENVNNVVSWRKPGIVHKKNEVYMDVIEKLKESLLSFINNWFFLCSKIFLK